MNAETGNWQAFLQIACFVRRLSPNKFADLVRVFQAQHKPIPGHLLIQPFIAHAGQDPRVIRYLEHLLKSGLLDINDVLSGLRPRDSPAVKNTTMEEPATHGILFQMLSSETSQRIHPETISRTLVLIVTWLERFPSSTALAFFAGTVLSQPCSMELLKPHALTSLSNYFII